MELCPRREDFRIPIQLSLTQHTATSSNRCMSVNLSTRGIYLNHLVQKCEKLERPVVGLEFQIPGSDEIIWAKGEIRYQASDDYFHGTGIEFTGMARKHQRLIRNFVNRQRREQLKKMLANVRRNRFH